MPAPATKNSSFNRTAQLLFEPVPLCAKAVNFGVHPSQEQFGRGRGYPGPLELKDFLALAPDLHPHVFDFPSDMVKVGHGSGAHRGAHMIERIENK
jgi:hypothetical protein